MLEGLYQNTEAAQVAGDTCCVQNAHLQKLLGLSGLGRAPRSSSHRPQPFLVAPTAWSPPCSSCPCPHAHPILLAPAHLCIRQPSKLGWHLGPKEQPTQQLLLGAERHNSSGPAATMPAGAVSPLERSLLWCNLPHTGGWALVTSVPHRPAAPQAAH